MGFLLYSFPRSHSARLPWHAEEIDAFLLPLPVGRLPGVGKVTGEKLGNLGVQTAADLRKLDLQALEQRFGRYGLRLHELARNRRR
jgi:DNA polymerase-4